MGEFGEVAVVPHFGVKASVGRGVLVGIGAVLTGVGRDVELGMGPGVEVGVTCAVGRTRQPACNRMHIMINNFAEMFLNIFHRCVVSRPG